MLIVNAVNDWFSNTLSSRLDNKLTGTIIVVHAAGASQTTLTGYLLENSSGWTLLSLPAIAETDEEVPIKSSGNILLCVAPARRSIRKCEPLEVLDKLRRELGSCGSAAQYQQSPVPPGGAMRPREWLRYYEGAPGTFLPHQGHPKGGTPPRKTARRTTGRFSTTWLLHDNHYYLMDGDPRTLRVSPLAEYGHCAR